MKNVKSNDIVDDDMRFWTKIKYICLDDVDDKMLWIMN